MLSLLFAAALAIQGDQSAAGSPEATLPVSLDRIRAALSTPAPDLTLQRIQPDFTIDITERQRFEQLIEPWLRFDRGTAQKPLFFAAQPRVGTTPALASVDLLALTSAIRRQLSGVRRERAVGAARGDVRRAVAEYCAAQPNSGAGIQICMDPTTIR